jgi:3',5'-cyclic-AMP phosphodiesterase
MAPIRLAIVADIHHGRDTVTKKGSAALPLLDTFIAQVNAGSFDAVIDLGDRISDQDPHTDRALQRAVAERFTRLAVPRHHVVGNHDRAELSIAENIALLDAPMESRSVTLAGVRIVFWQPDVRLTPARGFHLADGDLQHLARLLGSDDRPTLLVSHVPVSGHAQTGNYYFERNPGHATYAEIDAIRRVIAAAPSPVVAIAGHVHWNTLTTVDGTPHLTLQSLTEAFTTGLPSGCTAVLEIDRGVLRWTVAGRDPFTAWLPWRDRKLRWVSPLDRFRAEEFQASAQVLADS